MNKNNDNLKDRAYLFEYASGDKFKGKNAQEIFTEIMEENFWNDQESISGKGSTSLQTAEIIKKIPGILEVFNIKTIFDIPCGDFNWMNKIDLSNIKYLGADIVSKVIYQNIENYKKDNINFIQFDMIKDNIDKWDLIFCRDCLVHFSFADIYKTIENLKKSRSKYFMATTFTEQKNNEDIQTGGWRPLNLCRAPFNFPEPRLLLIEKCTEKDGIFKDKCLGLWEISNIKIENFEKV